MKIFLISLPESRERRLSGLHKVQACGFPFEIVDGVETRKMRSDALPWTNDSWADRLWPGQVGAYFAHLRALQRVVDYGLPWAYILEDDFCYEPDPDFGLVELAGVLPLEFDHIQLHGRHHNNPNYQRLEQQGPFWRVSETSLGTFGYVIGRDFAEQILEDHWRCRLPIDQLYAYLSPGGIFYDLDSPIVGVQEGFCSDVHA